MKKLLLIFLALISSTQCFAQDPDIVDTWYLTELTVDLGSSTYPSDVLPHISPMLTIEADLSFSGIAACNNYIGDFSYDPADDVLLLQSFDATLSACGFPTHDNFELDYFSYFQGTTYYYYVTTSGTDSILILEPFPGYEMIYQDSPLLANGDLVEPRFIIYPNPSSDVLFIASENILIESVSVYDLAGKLIISNHRSAKIDISSCVEGMYLIEITSSEGSSIKKFIKK